MKTMVFFHWNALWVGAYWNGTRRVLYICPLPMVVIAITWFKCQGECGKPFFYDGESDVFWCGKCIPF